MAGGHDSKDDPEIDLGGSAEPEISLGNPEIPNGSSDEPEIKVLLPTATNGNGHVTDDPEFIVEPVGGEAEPESGNDQAPATPGAQQQQQQQQSELPDKVDAIVWVLNSTVVASMIGTCVMSKNHEDGDLYNYEIMASNIAWVIVPPVCFFIILVLIFCKSKFHQTLGMKKYLNVIYVCEEGGDNLMGYAKYYFVMLVVSVVVLSLQLLEQKSAQGVFILEFVLMLPLTIFNVALGWVAAGLLGLCVTTSYVDYFLRARRGLGRRPFWL